jgi:hypothetical protein
VVEVQLVASQPDECCQVTWLDLSQCDGFQPTHALAAPSGAVEGASQAEDFSRRRSRDACLVEAVDHNLRQLALRELDCWAVVIKAGKEMVDRSHEEVTLGRFEGVQEISTARAITLVEPTADEVERFARSAEQSAA